MVSGWPTPLRSTNSTGGAYGPRWVTDRFIFGAPRKVAGGEWDAMVAPPGDPDAVGESAADRGRSRAVQPSGSVPGCDSVRCDWLAGTAS